MLGAIAVQSVVMVSNSVDRLLDDRITLARTTGNYIEHVIYRDLERMAGAALDVMRRAPVDDDVQLLRTTLGSIYPTTLFREGAFILDKDGEVLTTVPDTLGEIREQVDLKKLAGKSRVAHGVVTSDLIRLPVGDRRILVLLMPIFDVSKRLFGFAGGLFHPAASNLLASFEGARTGTSSVLQLVDTNGVVLSATRAADLYNVTDHGSLIGSAIDAKKEIRGRCHACHASPEKDRKVEILAFSPLPSLKLGIAVRQLENEALAPAFSLKKKLLALGGTFVLLYLFFTALAVHSVVRPIRRLTRAVGEIENGDAHYPIPHLGKDEIGNLAKVLDHWRNQVAESLSSAKLHQEALYAEMHITQRHIGTLESIAELSSQKMDLQEMAVQGLEHMLNFFGAAQGAIAIRHEAQSFSAQKGLSCSQQHSILEETDRFFNKNSAGVCQIRVSCQEPHIGVIGRLGSPGGIEVTCLLANIQREEIQERHLKTFLHHLIISASSRLLQEEEIKRSDQTREFIHRVLAAQEEERRRIARELHDTIAQDLAAHRLAIERLEKSQSPALQGKIKSLEENAHSMLLTVRQLLVDLRPAVLDTMGFLPALQWYLERTEREHHIQGTFNVEGPEQKLAHEKSVTLFRIFQESLQNTVIHAKATNILVNVIYDKNNLEMTIEDDGQGFDSKLIHAKELNPEGRGLGLRGMEERTLLLGGRLTIESTLGQGTEIKVNIPLEERL
ncbi:MAG: hypothetical protein A2X86_02095 [Bdellovibrionales bacterium GWA2_49_15]|nr:MAG: hypothetical protein A2X86_02095 [Bdellovibrionales bacterium GWA2_49_15]